jgi:hypothetical protein
MITNPAHVPEGRVVIALKDGRKVRTNLANNDRAGQVFWLETSEGVFEPMPYSVVAGARRRRPVCKQ